MGGSGSGGRAEGRRVDKGMLELCKKRLEANEGEKNGTRPPTFVGQDRASVTHISASAYAANMRDHQP